MDEDVRRPQHQCDTGHVSLRDGVGWGTRREGNPILTSARPTLRGVLKNPVCQGAPSSALCSVGHGRGALPTLRVGHPSILVGAAVLRAIG